MYRQVGWSTLKLNPSSELRGRPLIIWGGGWSGFSWSDFFFFNSDHACPQMINVRPLIVCLAITLPKFLSLEAFGRIFPHIAFFGQPNSGKIQTIHKITAKFGKAIRSLFFSCIWYTWSKCHTQRAELIELPIVLVPQRFWRNQFATYSFFPIT